MWCWIEQTLWKLVNRVTRMSFHWNPFGKRSKEGTKMQGNEIKDKWCDRIAHSELMERSKQIAVDRSRADWSKNVGLAVYARYISLCGQEPCWIMLFLHIKLYFCYLQNNTFITYKILLLLLIRHHIYYFQNNTFAT